MLAWRFGSSDRITASTRRGPTPGARLGREERIENAVDVRWLNPWTAILNCNDHLVGSGSLGSYSEHARAVGRLTHGFAGVHDQIEHHLLQLHAVG